MSKDNVNPSHYKDKPIEVIDCIESIISDLPSGEAFNAGQVIKYISRYRTKNGLEDLKKSIWYLFRLIKNYCGYSNEEILTIVKSILQIQEDIDAKQSKQANDLR